ncbi:MAG: hypothetical protein JW771_08005 [Candidatus Thermoplasmatota archaeon]|nr:hypothetical protein [Candidatus Thermoplasmatota archaeon]
MSEIPYKQTMDPKTKAIATIVVLLVIGTIVGLVISYISTEYVGQRVENLNRNLQQYIQALRDMYMLHTTIICINIFLLLGLVGIYTDTFRKTKSSFIFGLLLFVSVLLVQAIISFPVLQASLGFLRYIPSLFEILPNLFETIALIILLYLSME